MNLRERYSNLYNHFNSSIYISVVPSTLLKVFIYFFLCQIKSFIIVIFSLLKGLKMILNKIKYYYNLAKAKKIDTLLILVGILGVLIGLFFSIPIINQIFVWFTLFGICIKLYDFTEKIEREIVPYDFNMLLPPPSKKKNKR